MSFTHSKLLAVLLPVADQAMTLDWTLIGLGLVLGVVSGFFNAVASGGSTLILPALLSIGLPADIANATIRLPILLGSTTALWSFERAKLIPWRSVFRLAIVFIPFSLFGAELATIIDTPTSLLLVRIAVLVALVFLFIRPQRLLKECADDHLKSNPYSSTQLWLLTSFCGFWAGLIVVDSAIFMLLSLVLIGGVSLRQAVPIKTGLIFLFSIATFLIFSRSGKVEWQVSIPMVFGSIFGSLVGAQLAMSEHANKWVYRSLQVIVVVEAIRLFI
tara:strand:+ start:1552 stop:2373 length:822 start_codon:yes stop_codon:yes gene_type:complete